MTETGGSPILGDEETILLRTELARLTVLGSGSEDGARADEIYHRLVKSAQAKEEAALAAFRERMTAVRAGRDAADIPPGYEKAVTHLDGNPYNNDPANLAVVDVRDNRGRQ